MQAQPQDPWLEQMDDPPVRIDTLVDPWSEDAYWQSTYWMQPYCRGELEYEDYAPAYCVGYVGFAQYGGRFEDAEKSLCANWLRLQGDSRLSLAEAMQAVRDAWDRAAGRRSFVERPAMADRQVPCSPRWIPAAPVAEPAMAMA